MKKKIVIKKSNVKGPIMKSVKKAQSGQNQKTQETFKRLIKESDVRVNRAKNEATKGDVHADNEVNSFKRFGSRLSDAAARIYNPEGFEKKKAPNKVLSALSKKKSGGTIKKAERGDALKNLPAGAVPNSYVKSGGKVKK